MPVFNDYFLVFCPSKFEKSHQFKKNTIIAMHRRFHHLKGLLHYLTSICIFPLPFRIWHYEDLDVEKKTYETKQKIIV